MRLGALRTALRFPNSTGELREVAGTLLEVPFVA
jgi:hypothetical protein